MRPRDRERSIEIDEALLSFHQEQHPLPGIEDQNRREALIEQMVESIRRVSYVRTLGERDTSPRRTDPADEMFDPLRAALLHQRAGNLDEAYWLIFLAVHFGKSARTGWRTTAEVYGQLGDGRWDWARTSRDPTAFRQWLATHQDKLRQNAGFGNHRKYQSLRASSRTGTGATVESYVQWVEPSRTHADLMSEALRQSDGDVRVAFHALYRSMNSVVGFGRLGRFDYLNMVSNLGLSPIESGSTYMTGATGPVLGARLLFAADLPPRTLDKRLIELESQLGVGMQVIEDALCNWQKSPDSFVPFRG